MKKIIQRIYLIFIFVLLYAPILTLVVLSFNNSRTRAKWGGFTTKWYVSMFENSAIMDALYNTLLVGVLSAFIATLLGLTAAISINKMRRRSRTLVLGHAERGDCDRHLPDAGFYCRWKFSYPVWLYHSVWFLDGIGRACNL